MTTTPVRPSVVPDLIDALVAQVPPYLAEGVIVQDGQPDTWEVGDWLYVGVTDPDSPTPTNGASATQEWPLATATARNESGTLTCYALVIRGDGSVKDARDAVFAIAAGVMRLLRDDIRLGIPGMVRTSFESLDFDQGQTPDGALAVVTFRIAFAARI